MFLALNPNPPGVDRLAIDRIAINIIAINIIAINIIAINRVALHRIAINRTAVPFVLLVHASHMHSPPQAWGIGNGQRDFTNANPVTETDLHHS